MGSLMVEVVKFISSTVAGHGMEGGRGCPSGGHTNISISGVEGEGFCIWSGQRGFGFGLALAVYLI